MMTIDDNGNYDNSFVDAELDASTVCEASETDSCSSSSMAENIGPLLDLKEVVVEVQNGDNGEKQNSENDNFRQVLMNEKHLINEDDKAKEEEVTQLELQPKAQSNDEVPKAVDGTDAELEQGTNRKHQACQANLENPRRQPLIVLNLRRRLAEQEEANKRLRLEKDEQLHDITTSLLLLESQLRREQERIARILEEKDRKIAEQDRHLKALLRLNRRLAANKHRTIRSENGVEVPERADKKLARKQRRISWHNEVHVIVDYDRHWTRTNLRDSQVSLSLAGEESLPRENSNKERDPGTENIPEVREGAEEDSADFAKAVNEACEAVNQVLQESGGDSPPIRQKNLEEAGLEDKGHSIAGNQDDQDSVAPPLGFSPSSVPNPSSLGVYNRVMSKQRSVTKPKDVKYKKISRVKSRSLEELRGRLRRHLTHPPVLLEDHILLESAEEV